MNSIFEYFDYRIFLKDFYTAQKNIQSFFSYRYMAQKVNMDSSFIIKVLKFNLHISDQKILDFCKLCKLNEKESTYFETLVHFTKAKSEKESKVYFEKLLQLRDVASDKLTEFQYAFFSKWYYSAIWSILHYFPYQGDNQNLAEALRPCIKPNQARYSIKLLLSLGLIEIQKNGLYKPLGLNLTTGQEWKSLAISNYQKEMIKLSMESLERFPKKERDVSTLSFNCNEASLVQIQNILLESREQIKKITNKVKKSDRTYQLNFQLFPLSSVCS